MSDDWVMENELFKAWEKGFRAGVNPPVRGVQVKNPYTWRSAAPAETEHPGPPEFPQFYYRMDENLMESTERWATQMREFKTAWDEWAGGLR